MLKRLAVFLIIVFSMMGFSVTASAYQVSLTKSVYLDDNGTVTRHDTNTNTIEGFLKSRKVVLGERDEVTPDLKTPLEDGMTITVGRCKAVTVTLDDVDRKIYSSKRTVGELIEENKDILCEGYVIENAKAEDMVVDGMEIILTSGEVINYTKTEKMNFETTYIDDAAMYVGEEVVETAGVEGEIQVAYKEIYVKDALVSIQEVSRTVIKPAQNAVVRRGTCDTVNGIKFKKAINVIATGYTPYDEGCTGITASGKVAKFGMVAADTRVLPFGTKLYIPGYGYGVVEDRGGAIKGNRIDLCYTSLNEAFGWGVRDLTIYILE